MEEDHVLIERYLEGERGAFDLLVMKYQKSLYSFLFRMVGSQDDAADLLQRCFVKAFTMLGSYQGRGSFKTWLFQIAVNLAKNHHRDRNRFNDNFDMDSVLSDNPQPLECMIDHERRALLHKALAQLPEKQRLTVILRVQEGKKFEEISSIMECSLGTAKANYHHAVANLKNILTKDG